ncbi:hypothetical protein BJ742DRAFT_776480 [Cladochytrium replicatum]|nr:hypothetical protein BJ742DRAFT_776480 [Cladochytrium replicatum]
MLNLGSSSRRLTDDVEMGVVSETSDAGPSCEDTVLFKNRATFAVAHLLHFRNYIQDGSLFVDPKNRSPTWKPLAEQYLKRFQNIFSNIYARNVNRGATEKLQLGTMFEQLPNSHQLEAETQLNEEEYNMNKNDPLFRSAFEACDTKKKRALPDFLKLLREAKSSKTRGAHGETILHKLILWSLRDKQSYVVYRRLIEFVLDDEHHRRVLINSYHEGPRYRGESAVHMAVEAGDLSLLKFLVSRGADLNIARCGGEFFAIKNMGGTVLGMAVRNGHRDIATYLLRDCRVESNAYDEYGNTALHVLAWWGITSWTKHAKLEEDPDNTEEDAGTSAGSGPWQLLTNYGASLKQRNKMCYTPLLTAVYRRNKGMVQFLLGESRKLVWEVGEVKAYLYPLTDIDINPNKMLKFVKKIGQDGKNGEYNQESSTASSKNSEYSPGDGTPLDKIFYQTAIEIAVRNGDGRMLMDIPLFQIVLRAKWHLYARDMFNWYFLRGVLYQLLFLFAMWVIPNASPGTGSGELTAQNIAEARRTYFSTNKATEFDQFVSTYGVLRLCLEVLLVIVTIVALVEELFELKNQKPKKYFRGFNSAHNFLQLFNILILVFAFACRVADKPLAENSFLSIYSVSGWMSLLYFGKGLRSIGPTLIMVYKMLMTDVFQKFAIIYVAIVIAFSQAIWLQMAFIINADVPQQSTNATAKSAAPTLSVGVKASTSKSSDDDDVGDYGNPWRVALKLFGLIVNGDQFKTLNKAQLGWLAVTFFSVFMILTSILLLNVLIAMLNSTYNKVTEQSEEVWVVQWASLILEMDEKMSETRCLANRLGFKSTRFMEEEEQINAEKPKDSEIQIASGSDQGERQPIDQHDKSQTEAIAERERGSQAVESTYYFEIHLRDGIQDPTFLSTHHHPDLSVGETILAEMRKTKNPGLRQLNTAELLPKPGASAVIRRGGVKVPNRVQRAFTADKVA